jgi:hypothetical protein
MNVDDIKSLRMVIGDNCRVESLNDGDTRTLTVTTSDGVICTFKGDMEFTWVLPPNHDA